MGEIIAEVGSDAIAVVTLNRPHKRNAVSLAMWRRLTEIFIDLDADTGVRVVILTGAGGHFCAGADISEFADLRSTEADGRVYDEASDGCEDTLTALAKPTIAAIDGVCIGGGLGLAVACDFRLASAGARFGVTAGRLGIVYGLPETQKLVNAVGITAAKRILMRADIFDAGEAQALGLVAEVVAEGALSAARRLATDMAGKAPASLAGAKFIVNAIAEGRADGEATNIEAMVLDALASEDYREGQAAFAEKRAPAFKGR